MQCERAKRYFAELIGTFTLVFFGCGAAVIAGEEIGFLGISLAFGLTLTALVYAIGPVSGCHVNPAVTIAMRIAGKICTKDSTGYIISQCIGATLGAAVIGAIAGFDAGNFGQNAVGAGSPGGYDQTAGLIAEFVLTFLFLFIIFGATKKPEHAGFAGLAIGAALTIIHLVGIPVTGTSVNPARSFGPAVFAGGEAISQLWIFWVAPIAGAALAAVMQRACCKEDGSCDT